MKEMRHLKEYVAIRPDLKKVTANKKENKRPTIGQRRKITGVK